MPKKEFALSCCLEWNGQEQFWDIADCSDSYFLCRSLTDPNIVCGLIFSSNNLELGYLLDFCSTQSEESTFYQLSTVHPIHCLMLVLEHNSFVETTAWEDSTSCPCQRGLFLILSSQCLNTIIMSATDLVLQPLMSCSGVSGWIFVTCHRSSYR